MSCSKQLLLLCLCLASFGAIRAQSTEDSVKAAVNLLFTGMKESDATLVNKAFADSAILQTINKNKEGKDVVRTERLADFAGFVGKSTKGDLDERIRIDVLKIDGPLAIVWAPYTFYFKGNKNHCGVDSFQMIRGTDGVWRILYLIDTRRKDCE